MTEPGLVLGTIGYMAPEQAQTRTRRRPRRPVQSRRDNVLGVDRDRSHFRKPGTFCEISRRWITAPALDVRRAP